MKRFIRNVFLLGFLIAAAVAGYVWWYLATPLTMSQVPVSVEIPRGATLRTALNELEKAGVSVHRREFVFLTRAFGRERDLKAGMYLLSRAPTPVELAMSTSVRVCEMRG